jgi:hypothetical protein
VLDEEEEEAHEQAHVGRHRREPAIGVARNARFAPRRGDRAAGREERVGRRVDEGRLAAREGLERLRGSRMADEDPRERKIRASA